MKKIIFHIVQLLFIACFILLQCIPAPGQGKDILDKIKGSWVGKLKFQGVELTVVFNITANDKDSLIVTMDSPDQGAKNIPTSKVILTADSLIVRVKSVMGSYKGSFKESYTQLTGTWKQSGISFPLELFRQENKYTLKRPQEPGFPLPYLEEQVVFTNAKAGIVLSGTLTKPEKGGPFPAVILITGSGPQDRNEEVMGHKPFLVLADYLTRQGLAVLRYDDRGVGKSGGSFSSATTADFADDATAALNFLKTRTDIDTLKTGLIGHSEGGIVAAMVASGRKDASFIVLMAGPGLNGERIVQMQSALIAKANGADDKEIEEVQKINKKAFEIVKKYKDDSIASEKLLKLLSKPGEKDSAGDRDQAETAIRIKVKSLISPWFRFFLTYEPSTALVKIRAPLYAIYGEKDMQVPPRENMEAVEKAMILAGNSRYTVEIIPGVNHLFQTAPTGNPSEYSAIEETISPGVLESIGKWIQTAVK